MIMVLVYQSERELNPFTTNQTNRRLSIEGRHGNRCWLISPVNVILLPLNCFRIVWKWNLTSMGKKDYSCGIIRFIQRNCPEFKWTFFYWQFQMDDIAGWCLLCPSCQSTYARQSKDSKSDWKWRHVLLQFLVQTPIASLRRWFQSYI